MVGQIEISLECGFDKHRPNFVRSRKLLNFVLMTLIFQTLFFLFLNFSSVVA